MHDHYPREAGTMRRSLEVTTFAPKEIVRDNGSSGTE
jgi:hypothetical protein